MSNNEPLSLEAKAHYAASILAEQCYRNCPCWRVRTFKERVYGKPLTAQIAELNQRSLTVDSETVAEVTDIEVRGDMGGLNFTPQEAYLIARSLVAIEDA